MRSARRFRRPEGPGDVRQDGMPGSVVVNLGPRKLERASKILLVVLEHESSAGNPPMPDTLSILTVAKAPPFDYLPHSVSPPNHHRHSNRERIRRRTK